MELATYLNPLILRAPDTCCTATSKALNTTQLHSLCPAYLTRFVKGLLPYVTFPTPLSRILSDLSKC